MTSLHADEAFLAHYQFTHDPFAARVPGFKFYPAQRKPVLGQLHHLARYSQLLLVVTGPQGSGKTLLRQALVASTNKQAVQSVVISARGAAEAGGLMRLVAQGLGVAQTDSRSILAQVGQLALTGQEVYLLVDDAEELDDAGLDNLLALAAGNSEARPHVFLFADSSLLPRLELLADGEERFHAIELLPYSEDETREYLAQRLEGAGQGIELLTEEQIEDVHLQSGGWPGGINQSARELLVEAMLAERGASRKGGFSLNLPKKHLLALGVVAIGVVAALAMQNRSDSPATTQPTTAQLPMGQQPAAAAEAPAGQAPAPGGAPAVEFAGSSQPLPLPLVGEAQPVIREPLAQAAGQDDLDDGGAQPGSQATIPPTVTTVAPPVGAVAGAAPAVPPAPVITQQPAAVKPIQPIATAPTSASSAPAAVPAAPAKPAVAATPPAKPAEKPAAAKPAAAPTVASAGTASAGAGDGWYRSQAGGHYAVQILGTSSEGSAKAFVQQNGGEYRYFKKVHQGKPLYVVTYGNFASRNAAQAAIKGLPAKVQAGKPWPKSFASIQQEIAR